MGELEQGQRSVDEPVMGLERSATLSPAEKKAGYK